MRTCVLEVLVGVSVIPRTVVRVGVSVSGAVVMGCAGAGLSGRQVVDKLDIHGVWSESRADSERAIR